MLGDIGSELKRPTYGVVFRSCCTSGWVRALILFIDQLSVAYGIAYWYFICSDNSWTEDNVARKRLSATDSTAIILRFTSTITDIRR